MRHRKDHRKLNRTSAHRKAMFANMTASLIKHDRIETTLPKAKELRRFADRMVTLAKSGTLAARRRAIAIIRDKDAVGKAFAELSERFADRNGGYTRILKLGNRRGDAAPMAIIEYIASEKKSHGTDDKKKAKKASAKKASAKKEAKKETKKAVEEKGAKAKKAPARKAAPKKAAAKKETKKAAEKKRSGRKVTKKRGD